MQNLEIRSIEHKDIDRLVSSFLEHNWTKPSSLFENYLKEEELKLRKCWLALIDNQVAGYVTLNWYSKYQEFYIKNIPEIKDLNVLPPFRCKGIATLMLDVAEQYAQTKSSLVGIGVGLYDGYGQAQRLYVKRGYVPNGLGPTYKYKMLQYGEQVLVDDDLVLWFTKKV